MTIAELAKEMREAAEKATPGPWLYDDEWRYIDSHPTVCQEGTSEEGEENVCVACLALMGEWDEQGKATDATKEQWHGDASFIAKADPANVLRLLDALDKRTKALDELIDTHPFPGGDNASAVILKRIAREALEEE
jgi:hypothetical protein